MEIIAVAADICHDEKKAEDELVHVSKPGEHVAYHAEAGASRYTLVPSINFHGFETVTIDLKQA